MTSSDRGARRLHCISIGAALVLSLPALRARAEGVRVGGVLGFGIAVVHEPGSFRWDFDPARGDTTLAVLHLGADAAGLRGFLSLGARLDARSAADGSVFELRQASLAFARRGSTGDSAAVRLFARQPGSLWLDHALALPVWPAAAAGENALGARADVAWRALSATFLAADREGLRATLGEAQLDGQARDGAAGDLWVVRLRGDIERWAGLRLGSTWKRVHPGARWVGTDPSRDDAGALDVIAFDARSSWRGFLVAVEYAQSSPDPASGIAGAGTPALECHGWRRTGGRRLTDVLPSAAALRAELRSRGLRLGRYGTLGFAPQVRAIGSCHVDRLVAPERDAGNPRRGLDGYRLEAWYEVPGWPAWVRQVYDRHQEFRDADRRAILQESELRAQLTERVRGRCSYVQRDVLLPAAGRREYHDDLMAELVAEDGRARLRLQGGLADVGTDDARTRIVLETAARVGGRVQAVSRLGAASDPGGVRESVYVELQYWHLPQFELALRYGADWIGDASDPVLDEDLIADGRGSSQVRLHFRGWF